MTDRKARTEGETEMTKTFEINGKTYRTDDETLRVLRSIVPSAKQTGDSSAVIAVIALGEITGRVVQQ